MDKIAERLRLRNRKRINYELPNTTRTTTKADDVDGCGDSRDWQLIKKCPPITMFGDGVTGGRTANTGGMSVFMWLIV